MRYLSLFICVVLLLSASVANAQENPVVFSGKWVLNAEKSELGGGPGGRRGRMAASRMVVEQKDNKLVVEAFRQNRDGEEVSTVSTYTLDGKESKNETNFGTTVSVAKWSKDGKTLTIESTMTMSRGDREFTIESTAVWSLEKDTLMIETTRSTPRGERTSKAVYDKAYE
jgi:dipeptidyl aminopeptidase/acylaminoacyl peptidase